jgi:hypothetical protein
MYPRQKAQRNARRALCRKTATRHFEEFSSVGSPSLDPLGTHREYLAHVAGAIFGLAALSSQSEPDDVSTFRKPQKYSRETPKQSSTLSPFGNSSNVFAASGANIPASHTSANLKALPQPRLAET